MADNRLKWMVEDLVVAAEIARHERRMGAIVPAVNLMICALGFIGLAAFIMAVL